MIMRRFAALKHLDINAYIFNNILKSLKIGSFLKVQYKQNNHFKTTKKSLLIIVKKLWKAFLSSLNDNENPWSLKFV